MPFKKLKFSKLAKADRRRVDSGFGQSGSCPEHWFGLLSDLRLLSVLNININMLKSTIAFV